MTALTARPTVYKGVRMRSRLEAGFAAWLDKMRFEWEYEPCAFATERGQYLPDFRINVHLIGVHDAVAYVEVKPKGWFESAEVAERQRLAAAREIVWESDPGTLFLVVQPDSPVLMLVRHPLLPPATATLAWVHAGAGHSSPALAFCAGDPWPDGYWRAGV